MNVKLIDSESGEWVSISSLGNGQDSGDKAVMKAETASIKYAYMMAFNISTGDDPEADTRTDQFEAAHSVSSYSGYMDSYQAPPVQQSAPRVSRQSRNSGYTCSDCGSTITEKVSSFSLSRFGKALCMNCQKSHKSA